MTGEVTPADILAFWRAAGRDRWYKKDDAFDDEVRRRYLDLWHEAAAGKLSSWEATDDGALALTIVLDQFPRNMFRGDPRTHASDCHGMRGGGPRHRPRRGFKDRSRAAGIFVHAVHAFGA